MWIQVQQRKAQHDKHICINIYPFVFRGIIFISYNNDEVLYWAIFIGNTPTKTINTSIVNCNNNTKICLYYFWLYDTSSFSTAHTKTIVLYNIGFITTWHWMCLKKNTLTHETNVHWDRHWQSTLERIGGQVMCCACATTRTWFCNSRNSVVIVLTTLYVLCTQYGWEPRILIPRIAQCIALLRSSRFVSMPNGCLYDCDILMRPRSTTSDYLNGA